MRLRKKEKLIVADTLINNFPDSALKIVMSIDKSCLSKAENAHHDALLLYARYRNYLTDTITDDSIADKALEYLMVHPENRQLMLTWFCKGYVDYLRRNYAGATTASLHSLAIADSLDDDFFRARSHQLQGDVWRINRISDKALQEYRKASEYFKKNDSGEHYLWSRIDEVRMLQSLGRYREAYEIIDSIKGLGNSYSFKKSVLENAARSLLYLERFHEAKSYIDTVINLGSDDRAEFYALRSQINSRWHKTDDAKRDLDSAVALNNYATTLMVNEINYARLYLAWALGDLNAFVAANNNLTHTRDSINITNQKKSIINAKTAYLETVARNNASSAHLYRKRNLMMVGISIGLLLLCGAIILYYRRRISRKQESLDERMRQIVELSESRSELLADNQRHLKTVGQLKLKLEQIATENNNEGKGGMIGTDGTNNAVSSRFEVLRTLSDLYFKHADTSKKKSAISAFVDSVTFDFLNDEFIESQLAILYPDFRKYVGDYKRLVNRGDIPTILF